MQVKRHAGYECISSLTEGTKVVGYITRELVGSMEVLWEENNVLVLKVGGVRIGGVYWQPEWRTEETEERLAVLGRKLEGEKKMVIGDWNAHHELWACEHTQNNARGRQIVEWMEAEGLHLGSTKGKVTRQQGESKSAIDFPLVSDPEEWEEGRNKDKKEGEEEEEEWGMSDHQMIWGTHKGVVQRDAVWKVVDWDKLKDTVKGVQEGGVEEEDGWYNKLPGDSPYDKLQSLQAQHLKTSHQGKWAKRWWDDEVSAHCKAVQKAGRGGVGPGERERENERRRVQTWKTEKARLKRVIQEKKRECWQKYAEEQLWDDVWKLVKFAKDPWQTKETMKDLKDDDGAQCESDNDKLKALVSRNFFTKEQEPLKMGMEGELEEEACGYSVEELEGKVREAL